MSEAILSTASRRRRTGESELVTIDSESQNVEDGFSFTAFLNDAALANGAFIELHLVIPALANARVKIEVALGGDATFKAFAGTTNSATAGAVTATNRNTFSTNTALMELYSGSTLTGDGTLIVERYIFGGSGGNRVGDSIDSRSEVILSPGEYLLRLTNDSGGVERASIAIDWHENP